nr:transketolase [Neorickettsia helminthoeca]
MDSARMSAAIRILTIDAVSRANSGHPGMPLGMADVATVLFTKFLKFNPSDPDWPDRDRFILSAGHGSMLLYSLLYLTGYPDYTLEEIKNFRQLHSKTPGHPEYGVAKGIENTSGPLGQGLGIGIGMALAEAILSARFGRELVDHHTYIIAGDGCLMEGISHEAASFAGHMKLRKVILLFDDNKISIDGSTSLCTSDEHMRRFESYGWHTQEIDGHDFLAIEKAIENAKLSDKPSIIAARTIIGRFMPKEGTEKTHSGGLSETERIEFKRILNYPTEDFQIPEDVLNKWRTLHSIEEYQNWRQYFSGLPHEVAEEFNRALRAQDYHELAKSLDELKLKSSEIPSEATRQSSGRIIKFLTSRIPEMIGGSCDLTGSNNVTPEPFRAITKERYNGNYIYYGVREHFMAACMNGMALHKGVIPYGGTFFIFSDYLRPAIRMSALMGIQVIYVMTHDSIGVGEDGPTHQPIEHLDSLNLIPNLYLFRPCDYIEVLECWQNALKITNAPSMIVLSRQKIDFIQREPSEKNMCAKGAYIIRKSSKSARISLIASGSEVAICAEAQRILEELGYPTALISVPCMALLKKNPDHYISEIIEPGSISIAVESGSCLMMKSMFNISDDALFNIEEFGLSAPYTELYKHFAMTPDAIVERCIKKLSGKMQY